MLRGLGTMAVAAAGVGGVAYVATGMKDGVIREASASDSLPAAEFPWTHSKPIGSYDHAAIRRGFKVYTQVCATCHSLNLIHYRNLVDVAFTEDELKEMAAEITVIDGVDDEGEPKERPGKLTDAMPAPYPNEAAARSANNGGLPPDLSLITKARVNGQNYVMSLLTGYSEPPAGFKTPEGQYYNAYFPGGNISMRPPLSTPGQVEYDDGTEASVEQMAKDVTTFLAWAAEPEHDDRKRMGIKTMTLLALLTFPMLYWKRLRWSVMKNRKVIYHNH